MGSDLGCVFTSKLSKSMCLGFYSSWYMLAIERGHIWRSFTKARVCEGERAIFPNLPILSYDLCTYLVVEPCIGTQ